MGVDRLVVSTNLLRFDRQILREKLSVLCYVGCGGGGFPTHSGGVRRPCSVGGYEHRRCDKQKSVIDDIVDRSILQLTSAVKSTVAHTKWAT